MQNNELSLNNLNIFSFKENDFIGVQLFIDNYSNCKITILPDIFIIEIDNKKNIFKYEVVFEIENEYYFITKQKEKLFLLDNCRNNFFLVEYNIFIFLRLLFVNIFSFISLKWLLKNFITNKSFIKILFLLFLLLSYLDKTKENEINDIESIYISDYRIINDLSKLILNKINLEK